MTPDTMDDTASRSHDGGIGRGESKRQVELDQLGRGLAIVIGINDYDVSRGIPLLHNAVKDASAIAELLADHHAFETRTFCDKETTTSDRLRTLFRDELPVTARAYRRILIYFAGHGQAEEDTDAKLQGWILPCATERAQADEDKDGVIVASELTGFIRAYMQRSNIQDQTPLHATLDGHAGGEFIFLSRPPPAQLPEADEISERTNPYRGLGSYQPDDHLRYGGRTRDLRSLVNREFVKEFPERLVVLSAPSGSGKSSLLHAGLVPALRARGERVVSCTVDGSPFSALRRATGVAGAKPEDVARVLANATFLVVDQLEDLARLPGEAAERVAFWRTVLEAHERSSTLCIVMAVRSGFEDAVYDCGIGEDGSGNWTRARWRERMVPLYPLTRDDLRAAILAPAEAHTVFFTPNPRNGRSLLDTVLDELERTPSPLPVLSLAMSAMYRELVHSKRGGREIGWDEYDRVAPIGGVLAGQLAAIHEGRPGEAIEVRTRRRDTLRRVMLRLVNPGTTSHTGRPVLRSDLRFGAVGDGREDERVKDVLDDPHGRG